MKTLTVITTTYNRAYCLHQVYGSLCRQTSHDFVWLVVDDGSTDNTAELVKNWTDERKIDIEYFFKPNGGMHTARNAAYERVRTEINVIIDSDDWMTDDAVEKIVAFWKEHRGEQFYGIAADNVSKDGTLIGTELPEGIAHCTLTELFGKYHTKGDKKLILRSDLSRKYPYPEFPGEKFYPASYKYKLLDLEYELLLFPAAVCVVDYNEDSMTFDKFAQYRSCCRGFAHYRNEMIRISASPKTIVREMVHYVAESKFAGNRHYVRNSAKPVYAAFCLPLGLAYHAYLSKTTRKY